MGLLVNNVFCQLAKSSTYYLNIDLINIEFEHSNAILYLIAFIYKLSVSDSFLPFELIYIYIIVYNINVFTHICKASMKDFLFCFGVCVFFF